MGRAKPMLSELDPWFEERGYKRSGRKTEWKKHCPVASSYAATRL